MLPKFEITLTNGGNPHMKDNDGNTPRKLAEQQDNIKCAQLLQNYQTDSGDTEEEEPPRFSYSVYSDQTDVSSYHDSEFSSSSYSSRISDFGECPLSSTRRSSFFNCNVNERPNGRGLCEMDDKKRCSQGWNSWAFDGPSILSSTRMSTAGFIGTVPVVKGQDMFTDDDRFSLSKRDAPLGLHSRQVSRKSVSFRDVDEYFPVFSPESPKGLPPDECTPRSLSFDLKEYSDFLDTERLATVLHTQGIDVTSPDHVYVFCRESSDSTDEVLEKTVISQCALHECDEEEQKAENVNAVQAERVSSGSGSGSSSGTTSSHYSSCDSDHYTSAFEGPNLKHSAVTEKCPEMDLNKDSTEAKGENRKHESPQSYEACPQPESKCENTELLSDCFDNLSLTDAKHQNNDATALCHVTDEVKAVTENPPADQFDGDLSFTPSPFVTGRTRSRLSRSSMRNSRTPESLLVTSTLFEDTLPTPVRSRRQTPRSQSSDGYYNDICTASPTAYYTNANSVEDPVQAEYQDTQPSTLRASSSVNGSQTDTIILPKTVDDTIPLVETQDDTFILDKRSDIMDAYERNFAEIVKAIQNKNLDNQSFLTDDLTSTDEGKSAALKDNPQTLRNSAKEDEAWTKEDCSTQPESVSSSSSSSYFSPRRSREDSDPPCAPGTGCTPRYSMSRLSGWNRPRSLANISYTPGGRPHIDDVDEPVEYLYTDTEQGHKFVETHIPPTANTSLSTTSSEETILYDWRSMHKDVIMSKDKENQEPQAVPQKSFSDSDVDALSETRGMTDKELRIRLLELGESPGPISSRTRPTYMRRLCRLLQDSKTQSSNRQQHSDQTQSGQYAAKAPIPIMHCHCATFACFCFHL
uniref:LEM domain-containing protein n=1 Tax=Neogobius melanostomus TaxID=47308 RepID=A0A8C6S5Z6_9GOBI